jgi:hypothetical protein
MWALDNQTTFSAERLFLRDEQGAEVFVLLVKATLTVSPDGRAEMADKQLPIAMGPEYLGEPGKSSLLFDSDVVLSKATTDVLVHGHAYAPDGKVAREFPVRLEVGSLVKTLRIVGNRHWEAGVDPVLSQPEPFLKLPLRYEYAYGGVDRHERGREPKNPVGVGFVADRRDFKLTQPPNVEHWDAPFPSAASFRPAGFGPVARDWSPRLELAGTYDAAWNDSRKPLFPSDFDRRFYQAAPEDQLPPRPLVGGELVRLFNMTPNGFWEFRVPRVPLFCTTLIGWKREVFEPKLHTLVIEPDLQRVVMTWHAARPCHQTLYSLRSASVALKHRVTLARRPASPSEERPRV